jgi:hypothetical protein
MSTLAVRGSGTNEHADAPGVHAARDGRSEPAQPDISYDDLDKFKYYTIGPACAFCCRFALFPFSLVKTRLQMQRGGHASPASVGLGAAKAAEAMRYTGTFDAFGKILRHEGPRGLFKGFGVSCIGMACCYFRVSACRGL